jgi:putative nucleotidyltransferase with HDIG domain
VPSSTAAKPKLAEKYPTWGGWVDSGDWAKASPTGTLTLPANASEIMILALDPDVSVTQLARVTSRDQVLAARMLRLANSAYCAPLQEITTISEAVVRLGTASVRNVVLATCMASRLQSGNTYGTQGRGLAAHGIGTAFLAQVIARVAVVNQEEAFLYGLVHDIGKLLVLQLSKDYVRGGGKAPSEDDVLQMVEARHAEFGGRVLREWRLPPVIEEPVVYHHRPEDSPSHTLEASVCYLANRLSHRYGFGCEASPDVPVLDDPVAQKLGLSETWLADLDPRAPELFKAASDAFA